MKRCSPKSCLCYSGVMYQRHVMTLLCVFGIAVAYFHRVCISITIVEMVVPFKVTKTGANQACPHLAKSSVNKKNIQGGTLNWSEETQSYILCSFYVGYVIMAYPAGVLCDQYGAKIFLMIGLGGSALCTLLIPLSVKHLHWYVLVALRIITGLFQAVIYPGVTSLMAHWVPLEERSTLGAMIMAGHSVGSVIGTFGSGMIISRMNNWTLVYYAFGGVTIVWLILFGVYVYSSPDQHPNILPIEKLYLEASLDARVRMKTPIREIISDLSVLSQVVCQFGNDYFLFTILSNLPKYMNNVLHFGIENNALLSSIPHVALYLSSVTSGIFSDYLIKRKQRCVVGVRIGMTVISYMGPAIFLLAAGYSNCNRLLAVIFFDLALFAKGPFYGGMKVNCLDITRNHAAVTMAIINGFGSIGGVIAPYVVGVVATENSLPQWHTVFWILFVVSLVTLLAFVVFAKAVRRPWDYSAEDRKNLPVTKKTFCTPFSWTNPRGFIETGDEYKKPLEEIQNDIEKQLTIINQNKSIDATKEAKEMVKANIKKLREASKNIAKEGKETVENAKIALKETINTIKADLIKTKEVTESQSIDIDNDLKKAQTDAADALKSLKSNYKTEIEEARSQLLQDFKDITEQTKNKLQQSDKDAIPSINKEAELLKQQARKNAEEKLRSFKENIRKTKNDLKLSKQQAIETAESKKIEVVATAVKVKADGERAKRATEKRLLEEMSKSIIVANKAKNEASKIIRDARKAIGK